MWYTIGRHSKESIGIYLWYGYQVKENEYPRKISIVKHMHISIYRLYSVSNN